MKGHTYSKKNPAPTDSGGVSERHAISGAYHSAVLELDMLGQYRPSSRRLNAAIRREIRHSGCRIEVYPSDSAYQPPGNAQVCIGYGRRLGGRSAVICPSRFREVAGSEPLAATTKGE